MDEVKCRTRCRAWPNQAAAGHLLRRLYGVEARFVEYCAVTTSRDSHNRDFNASGVERRFQFLQKQRKPPADMTEPDECQRDTQSA